MEVVYTIIALYALFMTGWFIYVCRRRSHNKKRLKRTQSGAIELTPEEFFRMRKESLGKNGKTSFGLTHNFAGVYVLYNKTKNMYYVGQGQRVFDRVNSHFTGKGNGDVYADYKYGDEFTITTFALEESGYSSLNELERSAIEAYGAFANGYNKTRGNRG